MDVNQLWNVANIWCQLIFTWMMWFSWMFDLTFRIYYVWINNTAQIASISVRIISIAVNVLLAFKCLNWFCGHFNHCQYLIFVMTILHSDPVVMYWCAPLYLHALHKRFHWIFFIVSAVCASLWLLVFCVFSCSWNCILRLCSCFFVSSFRFQHKIMTHVLYHIFFLFCCLHFFSLLKTAEVDTEYFRFLSRSYTLVAHWVNVVWNNEYILWYFVDAILT